MNVFAFNFVNHQFDKTVAEQKFISGFDFGIKFFVADRNVSFISGRVIVSEDEFFSGSQLNFTVFKFAEPHFRTFRVQDEGNNFVCLLRRSFNRIDSLFVFLVRSVRKIEPGAIHSVFDKLIDDSGRVGCRSLCAEDFRFFQHDNKNRL